MVPRDERSRGDHNSFSSSTQPCHSVIGEQFRSVTVLFLCGTWGGDPGFSVERGRPSGFNRHFCHNFQNEPTLGDPREGGGR